jgi:casein kinase II subunit alpha
MLERYPKKNWSLFVREDNASLANEEAIALLNMMLVYDHAERVLPKEAL